MSEADKQIEFSLCTGNISFRAFEVQRPNRTSADTSQIPAEPDEATEPEKAPETVEPEGDNAFGPPDEEERAAERLDSLDVEPEELTSQEAVEPEPAGVGSCKVLWQDAQPHRL